ncbi:MAG TPA: efflux RND transporter periplasmic adaptor subunit [Caulobacteraceae bacterium]|jgi:multidrug efflux system membrane fusion protein
MASRRRIHWGFAVLGAVAIALILWALFKPHPKAQRAHLIPVTVVRAGVEDIPISLTALGAAQAWTSDTILAQVSGRLLSVDFTEGASVRAGQVLAVIDPAPYRAALMQAEGTLARDEALLANARLDLKRYETLAAQDSIARQTADTQAALVKQDEGVVLTDRGAVAAAKVNLGWTRITSPISGRAGVRLVDPGNLVSASGSQASVPNTAAATNASAAPGGSTSSSGNSGGSGIVVINQIQPMAVTFTVPQGEFQHLSELSDGFRRPLATVAASQETGAVLDRGELRIADNRVDPSTGTVELKARFANAARRLWPGQFVNIELTLETLRGVVAIPSTAVNQGPNGPFVYIVGPKERALMRPVNVAWTQGVTSVIRTGVGPGDIVVTDGQMTLKPGAQVRIVQLPPVQGRR